MILDKLRLTAGQHNSPKDGACVMEVCAIAMGSHRLVDGTWREGDVSFTDLPACTDEAISRQAQRTWDNARSDEERLRLLVDFLPRLMRAKRTGNHKVTVAIALAAARHAEHLSPAAKECNDVTAKWLNGEATDEDANAAYAAYAAANAAYAAYAADAADAAAYAAYAAAYAAYAAAYAAYAAAAANAAYAADAAAYAAYAADAAAYAAADAANAAILDVMLTAHEKACAEQGLLAWDPDDWEQDALHFVDELLAEARSRLVAS